MTCVFQATKLIQRNLVDLRNSFRSIQTLLFCISSKLNYERISISFEFHGDNFTHSLTKKVTKYIMRSPSIVRFDYPQIILQH